MRVFITLLLAVAAKANPEADPALLYGAYGYGGLGLGHTAYGGYGLGLGAYGGYGLGAYGYGLPLVTSTVGGYKVAAGDNGELKGAVHEIPATTYIHGIGKREAEADPALIYGAGAYGYGGLGLGLGAYGYGLGLPATYAAIPQVETAVTALNNAVPVAVGGYKAVAGDNGDLKGAVHEVPALFGAPALHKQVNGGGSLTVGTGAVVTAKITGYKTIATPFIHGIGKREAEAKADAEADPAVLYSTYGYGPSTYGAYGAYGHGLGYGAYGAYGLGYASHGAYAGHGYAGHLGYSAYGYGSPYYG